MSANTRKIRNFSIPAKKAVTSLLLVLPACYAAASTVVEPPAQFPGLFNIANTYIRPMVGDSVLKGLGLFILVVHALESLYTAKILWKHVSSPLIGAAYVAATFVLGFPVWQDLKKRIAASGKKST